MAIRYRTADVIYSIHNENILSVSNLSSISTNTIQPSELRFVLDYIFNGKPNNATQNLSFASTVLLDYLNAFLNTGVKFPSAYYQGVDYLRAFLTIPLIEFNSGTGFNTSANLANMSVVGVNLPASLYTTATFGQSVSRISIDKWTVITFSVLAVAVYVWCLLYLVCTSHSVSSRSRFTLMEFAIEIVHGSKSTLDLLREAAASGDWKKLLLEKRLYFNRAFETAETEMGPILEREQERFEVVR